jgi:acetolactate synthase-1/2/3 large subunit
MSDIDQLANQIADNGVPMVFGIPGGGLSLSLIDALEKRDIPFHLTHFEGAASIMAATLGHLKKKSGVSLSIRGPGLVNSAPGIAVAWFESFPLVHITESMHPNASLAEAHKRLDHNLFMKAISKGSRYSSYSGGFQALADHALSEAPGPVILNLVSKPVDNELPFDSPSEAEFNLKDALDLIKNSKYPVVIAGSAAIRANLGDSISRLNCPIFSTVSAKGVIDEYSWQSCGVYTGVGLSLTQEANILPQADLVIGIGLNAKEVLSAKPFGCNYLAINAVQNAGDDAFNPTFSIGISGAEEVCCALEGKEEWGAKSIKRTGENLHTRATEKFLPGVIFDAIARTLDHPCVVMDTGNFCTIGEHIWRASAPSSCLLSAQGRYMGTSLPMAIAASIHNPHIPTIACVGDGGIGMYLSEVLLAAKLNLPVLIILMTDGAFGSIRTRAIKEGLTQNPLLMTQKSWVSIFESLGLASERAESLDQVINFLNKWKLVDGPAFLEIPFDMNDYESMTKDIR